METKRNLPKLADIYSKDLTEIAKSLNAFQLIVNHEPKPDWVKKNKYANNSNYIPIGTVETLLTTLFHAWYVEITGQGTAFNACWVTVRLHVQHIVTGEWTHFDGIGATEVQTKSGSSPADLTAINPYAVAMAFPAAKSYALKDAAEHIGKLFGRDLNRKDVLDYNPPLSISQVNDLKEIARIKEQIQKCDNGIDLAKLWELSEKYGLIESYNNQLKKISDGM